MNNHEDPALRRLYLFVRAVLSLTLTLSLAGGAILSRKLFPPADEYQALGLGVLLLAVGASLALTSLALHRWTNLLLQRAGDTSTALSPDLHRAPKPPTLRARLERGNAGLFFSLGMILILTAFAGYLYDVRRIALAQIHAQNTLDLAAHRAGSDIDIPRFKKDQFVNLAPDADGLALNTILSARKEEYSLSVSSVRLMYGGAFMEIRGQMTVPLGFLSRSFGLPPAKRSFLTIIQPAYGIQRQDD